MVTGKPFLKEDVRIISNLIEPGSSILDLGCGDGEFLDFMVKEKNIRGVGYELSQDHLLKCLNKGLNVIHGNLDEGLPLFDDDMFDYVILNETLQVLKKPIELLQEMLRVGKKCIVGVPNFGHWRIRTELALTGKMPQSEALPFEWYNTPNIHLCTIKDFEIACSKCGFRLIKKIYFKKFGSVSENNVNLPLLSGFELNFKNLLASSAVYLMEPIK